MRAQVSDSCPLTLTALGSQCLHVAPGACEELRLSLDQCAPPLDQAIFSTRPVRVFVICAQGGFARISLCWTHIMWRRAGGVQSCDEQPPTWCRTVLLGGQRKGLGLGQLGLSTTRAHNSASRCATESWAPGRQNGRRAKLQSYLIILRDGTTSHSARSTCGDRRWSGWQAGGCCLGQKRPP